MALAVDNKALEITVDRFHWGCGSLAKVESSLHVTRRPLWSKGHIRVLEVSENGGLVGEVSFKLLITIVKVLNCSSIDYMLPELIQPGT
jgi:hypothetical protein